MSHSNNVNVVLEVNPRPFHLNSTRANYSTLILYPLANDFYNTQCIDNVNEGWVRVIEDKRYIRTDGFLHIHKDIYPVTK